MVKEKTIKIWKFPLASKKRIQIDELSKKVTPLTRNIFACYMFVRIFILKRKNVGNVNTKFILYIHF